VGQERARQAAELIESFTQERERYLQTVEREVVKLALAVAARILRREAQMDPLLLTGAVRVALGQLSGSTQVRLHVPSAELELWRDAIALVPNLAVKPAVIAGEGMRLGDCKVETEMGSVDLGIRSQLGEIERGFFDRAGGSKISDAGKSTSRAESSISEATELVGAVSGGTELESLV
jgi:flagellar assembly protein FliH